MAKEMAQVWHQFDGSKYLMHVVLMSNHSCPS
jgi:hypothetical protein